MDLLRAQKAMIDLAHDKLILGDKLSESAIQVAKGLLVK